MEIIFWVCLGVAIVSHRIGKALGRVADEIHEQADRMEREEFDRDMEDTYYDDDDELGRRW